MKKTTRRTRQRRMTRREFVGASPGSGGHQRGAGDSARPESEQQVEHRVHRLRRSRQRELERTHHRARPRRGAAAAGEAGAAGPAGAASRRERRRALRREPGRAGLRVAALPAGQEVHRPPARLRSAERLRRRRGLHGGAHARVCHLPGADARQARLLREAARLQYLGNPPHPRDRREVPEAVHADGQPGPRLAGAAHDQGNPR